MQSTAFAEPLLKAAARDVTSDLDLSTDEVTCLLDLAGQLKADPARYAQALAGRSLSLLFEKPSLRTRVTFDLAIQQLGGHSVYTHGPIGEREPLKDVARNLDRWTQGIVARVFSQNTILELAHWSSVPVINALSDMYHPCQALADVMTIRERFGTLRGLNYTLAEVPTGVARAAIVSAEDTMPPTQTPPPPNASRRAQPKRATAPTRSESSCAMASTRSRPRKTRSRT